MLMVTYREELVANVAATLIIRGKCCSSTPLDITKAGQPLSHPISLTPSYPTKES